MRSLLPILASCMISLAASTSMATPMNADFESGLDAWSTVGSVAADDGGARLSDDGAYYSALHQSEALAGGVYSISFDFRAELSSEVPGGPFGFADTVFASIYLADDPMAFDLSPGSYDDAIALFDLDHTGAFGVAGSIADSTRRAGWQTFEYAFQTTYAYVIPTFELLDQNLVAGDSAFWVDNVRIDPSERPSEPIPEPGASLLFAAGILVAGLRLRRRSG